MNCGKVNTVYMSVFKKYVFAGLCCLKLKSKNETCDQHFIDRLTRQPQTAMQS